MTGTKILAKAIDILFSQKKKKQSQTQEFLLLFPLHFSFLHFALSSSALQLPLSSADIAVSRAQKRMREEKMWQQT